jgi:hypothetical protein
MLTAEAYGMILQFILDIEDIYAFQRMSLESYMASIDMIQCHSHFDVVNSLDGLHMYGHIITVGENSQLNGLGKFDSIYRANTFYYQYEDVSMYRCSDSSAGISKIPATHYHKWKSVVAWINREANITEIDLDILLLYIDSDNVRIMNMPSVRRTISTKKVYNGIVKMVDIRGLMWIRAMGDNFLGGLLSLKTIITSDSVSPKARQSNNVFTMPYLEKIGSHFLATSDLGVLEMCDMPRLKEIGTNFLSRCDKMKYFSMHYVGIENELPENFLCMLGKLNILELYDMPYVTGMGHESLNSLPKLKNLWLASMPNFTYFSFSILNGANSLENIDLTRLSNLKNIGQNFAKDCQSLRGIRIDGLKHLENIDDGFASNGGGESFDIINLKTLPALKFIGPFRIRDD